MEQVYLTVPDSASEEHHYFTNESITADQGEGVVPLEEGWRFAGFTQVENNVIRDADNLSLQARFTYTILRSYGWQDEVCWPGMARLCKDIGRSEKKVRQYIRELVDAGLIAKKRRGQGNTNTYRFRQPAGNALEQYTGNVQEQYKSNAKEYAEEEYSKNPSGGSTHAKKSSTPTPQHVEEHPIENNVIRLSENRPPKSSSEIAVSRLVRGIEDADGMIPRSSRGKYGKQFRRLADEDGVTDGELEKVVDRIVTRWPDIELSADRALSDVLNGRDVSEKAGRSAAGNSAGSATPEPALTALREHEKFGRFAAAAERHDFTSDEAPDWKILQACGATDQEQRENARLMGNVARNAMRQAEPGEQGGESENPGELPSLDEIRETLADENYEPGYRAAEYLSSPDARSTRMVTLAASRAFDCKRSSALDELVRQVLDEMRDAS